MQRAPEIPWILQQLIFKIEAGLKSSKMILSSWIVVDQMLTTKIKVEPCAPTFHTLINYWIQIMIVLVLILSRYWFKSIIQAHVEHSIDMLCIDFMGLI